MRIKRFISEAPDGFAKFASCLCLFVVMMMVVLSASGQQSLPALHRKVVLRSENIRFDSLLHLAGKQSGMKFSLNTQKFRPSKIIHVRKGECSMAEILAEIRTNTGIYYTILGDHIIFIDSPPARKTPGPASRTALKNHPTPASDRHTHPAQDYQGPVSVTPPASSSLHNPGSASFQSLAYQEDDSIRQSGKRKSLQLYHTQSDIFRMSTLTGVTVDKKYIARLNRLNPLPAASGNDHSDKNSRNKTRSDKEKKTFAIDAFVRPGLSTGETFYINPTIQAGLPFIYGIASWSTNFTISGFRYGIGGSMRLSDEWRLNVNATTGANAKNYLKDSLGGPSLPLTVKTHLHMICLLAETSINKRLLLQFGPTLNILQTKYYISGELSPLHVSETTANSKYTYIKPIYTIHNTYSSNAAQNTKIWVGMQVSLFYNLDLFRRR